MALIAPALFSADFARLGEALAAVEAAGVRRLQLEVMDGHFVPDITAGQPVIRSLRVATAVELGVHLLVERPERFIADMARAGADRIAIHAEATPGLHCALEQIKAVGPKVGLALNPATSLQVAWESLNQLDDLLILTADAGLGEGKYIARTTAKISQAAEERRRRGLHFNIVAAGGIGLAQVDALVEAGADILVAGSAVFNSRDPMAATKELMARAADQKHTSDGSASEAAAPSRRPLQALKG